VIYTITHRHSSLPDHIRVDIEMRDPQDLQMAMHYARTYEQRTNAMQ
jgi:hypothetical protein